MIVLTYHSHHVVGDDYPRNDHIALPIDLRVITELGFEIVPLEVFVDAWALAAAGQREAVETAKMVALTFDDGPEYDVADFVHPHFGPQRSFLSAMRDFRLQFGRETQQALNATSFVIASPEARRIMERTFDAEYTYLTAGSMEDAWWLPAIETGLIGIANHSWDHLHPALPAVAHSRQVRADFRQVLSTQDADAQIAAAATFIAAKTAGRAAPFFAYPFGHYNDFLVRDYLPRSKSGVRAAFSADPRPVTKVDSAWCLPRYVCGDDWKSPEALARIIADSGAIDSRA
jgi:peptidoglycan/xylan/chitin deacetylase (PgdA/CDA1 family)